MRGGRLPRDGRGSAGRGTGGEAAAVGTPAAAGRNRGAGRLLIAVYGIFAVAATARAVFQIATKFSEAPAAYSLTALAAVVYVLATVSLAKTGTLWFRTSVAAVGLELVGVLTVGSLSVLDPVLFPSDTVWSAFGQGYGFVPLVLPVIGLWWLYRHRPAAQVLGQSNPA